MNNLAWAWCLQKYELYLAMDQHHNDEIKKEFQLERIILFSDAVFAIIITIMVIEIKLPEGIREASMEKVREVFMHEIFPKLLGYATAFFFVGMFWMKHLKIFSFLKDYTRALIIYNLVFLFAISLFPFGVSVMTDSLRPKVYYGMFAYFNIIMAVIFTQTLLAGYLVRNAATICIKPQNIETNLEWKVQRLNLFAIPVIVVYSFIVYMAGLDAIAYALAFIFWGLLQAFSRKKYYPDAKSNGPVLARLFASRKKQKEIETTEETAN